MNQEKKKTVKCTNSVKKKCAYSGCIGGEHICDYLGKTGHRRGCSPKECDKYKSK